MHHVQVMVLTVSKGTFQWCEYIHIVVPLSPSPNSRTFHLPKLKLCPLNTLSAFPLLPIPWQTSFNFLSLNLMALGTSDKWNPTIFVWLIFVADLFHLVQGP